MSGAAVEIGNNRCSDSDGTTVRVRVIAPSSMGKPSNLEVFRRFLRDAGMTARVDDSIYRAGADPFYANTDQFRAADLVDALTDSCTVVWCARGGKGASRMIPYLEALPADRKQRIRDARKTLVGSFSVEEQPAGNCNGVPSPDDHLMALVFRRFAATVLFPVFRVDGIGHSFVNNPLPLNTEATVVGPTRLDDATETSIYTLTVDNVYNTGAQSCIRPPVPLDQAA
uniref:Putative LD carboxypeptidase n=1 Tax=Acyrthosiphon pisum TaxID=7029 RepID=B9ZYY6_ACYPI|nr:putative LD carboxypeptidase [Acyrthosiphon pisum]